MASRLVIKGKTETTFAPNDQIKRAEFASILVRAMGLKPSEANDALNFKDSKANDWFNADVQTAVNYGLISGYHDGTFKGNQTITREEAMVMLSKAMKWTKLTQVNDVAAIGSNISSFSDAAAIGNWSKQAVASAATNGIIKGQSKGKLNPKANITRAETAVMVERFLKKAELID